MEKMVRIQFEIPTSNFKDLEKLMEEAGIKTKSELLNNALSLLEWAINQRKRGRLIAAVDEENSRYQELLMPVFSRIRPAPVGIGSRDGQPSSAGSTSDKP